MRNPDKDQRLQSSAEPHRETVKQMIRQAVGPNLDGLSQATLAAKEARRLLEMAHWAGDREAEAALRRGLGLLAAATGGQRG
jgi:hypothetical protein